MPISLCFVGFEDLDPAPTKPKKGIYFLLAMAYTSDKADNHLSQHLSCLDNHGLAGAGGKHIRSPGGGKHVLHAVAVFYLMPNIGFRL